MPFKLTTAERAGSLKSRKVIGRLHVEVDPKTRGTIVIREGDDPSELVENFRLAFKLRREQARQLEESIRQQLAKVAQNQMVRDGGRSPLSRNPNSARPLPSMDHLTPAQQKLLRQTLQRTPTSPPTRHQPRSKPLSPKTPLFNLDLDIGEREKGRILVHEGDDPTELAQAFVKSTASLRGASPGSPSCSRQYQEIP